MLRIIQDTYIINEKTVAIYPAKKIEYDATVITLDGLKLVKQTPFQIIKYSCEAYWACYHSRRQATVKRTNFQRNVPIMINPERELITFPTHAPTNYECAWIFIKHVARLTRCTEHKKQTPIVFKNGYDLLIKKSYNIISNQYNRAETCLEIYRKENEHTA